MEASVWVPAIIALGAMAVAIWQGVAAHRSAGEAADQVAAAREQAEAAVRSARAAEEALGEARRQSDASERAAAASERANELAQAAMEPKRVRWEFTHFDEDTYQLKNTGDAPAFDIDLEPVDEDVIAVDVPVCMRLKPGESLTAMFVITINARDRGIKVMWFDSLDDRSLGEREELRLPLPPRPPRRSGRVV